LVKSGTPFQQSVEKADLNELRLSIRCSGTACELCKSYRVLFLSNQRPEAVALQTYTLRTTVGGLGRQPDGRSVTDDVPFLAHSGYGILLLRCPIAALGNLHSHQLFRSQHNRRLPMSCRTKGDDFATLYLYPELFPSR
jgi:hypothetical protein